MAKQQGVLEGLIISFGHYIEDTRGVDREEAQDYAYAIMTKGLDAIDRMQSEAQERSTC